MAETPTMVPVSPEMVTWIGSGPGARACPLLDPVVLQFALSRVGSPATLLIHAELADRETGQDRGLVCLIERGALERLFGFDAAAEDGRRYHLSSELRAITLAIADCVMQPESAREAYRIGKSIELLCETMRALAASALVPVAGEAALSSADSGRLVTARRIIDERWAEKLTLDGLARACGLNRAKLTRGFRELYRCTVAEAIAERRLLEASRQLRTTDLPVSSIGYASGYLNNASFSRAFGRRFGVSPTVYRDGAAAVAA